MPTQRGSFRIFTLAGIGVYVHWSWFLVAIYSIQYRTHEYSSMTWNVLEYLSLFAIVLTHEFGHQLACRSVGGKTHDIVLWPLGGVAYVSPPQRPGAQLWSIAAGPLVNVILVPITTGLVFLGRQMGWDESVHDAFQLLNNICLINLVLLIFNMMPVYPLDGGQILRSLLWFPFGRANSLLAASIIGFIGVAGLVGLAIWAQSIWLGIMTAFILMNCWGGLKQARALARIAKLPRRDGFACPSCKTAPPLGELWRCGKCGKAFDTFLTQGNCPHCGTQFNVTQCLDCGTSRPISEWSAPQNRFNPPL
ncbi:MAG TPA: site-2 protease family protein [Candidatus Dormibacteraeota bacterium]|nr:site-2 protease family protein [Candidatus Dormibacteraeota bacterium]